VVGTFDDDGGAVSLPDKTVDFGMTTLAVDDNLAAVSGKRLVAAAYLFFAVVAPRGRWHSMMVMSLRRAKA